MNGVKTKKSFTALSFITLALAASLAIGLMGRYSANAKSEPNSSHASISPSPATNAPLPNTAVAAQSTGIVMPKTSIYALNADNTIFVLTPGSTTGFTRLARVTTTNGNLIGIDFRVADGLLYAVTDTGSLYTINLTPSQTGAATQVSDLTTRFAGGFQSLADFNPVVNALRLIGTNDQNIAVVNSNGNLNGSAVQTAVSYAAGDVNAGKDPNIAGGSYTNNFAGATVTLFYGIDYDLDTFVTIQPATPGGSSATGGGKLQTIGHLVTPTGDPVNVAPTADIDIYSDGTGGNSVIGVSGRTLFTIDLSKIDPNLALGKTQHVVASGITMPDSGGGFIDLAVSPVAAPAPAPTPTPTPAALRISGVAVSNISKQGVTIRWQTNTPSDSQVEFGLTTAYRKVSPLDRSLTPIHSINLGNLIPGALYHYRVRSRDSAGNLAVSGDFTFRTTIN
jgi:hypothetical protein